MMRGNGDTNFCAMCANARSARVVPSQPSRQSQVKWAAQLLQKQNKRSANNSKKITSCITNPTTTAGLLLIETCRLGGCKPAKGRINALRVFKKQIVYSHQEPSPALMNAFVPSRRGVWIPGQYVLQYTEFFQQTIRRHAPQRHQNGDRGGQQKHGEGKRGAEPQPGLHNKPDILAGIAKDGRSFRALHISMKRRRNSPAPGCRQRYGVPGDISKRYQQPVDISGVGGVHGAQQERGENGGDGDSNLQPHFAVLAAD